MAGLRGQDLEAEKQRAQQQGDSSRGAQLAIQHTYEEVSMPKWEAMKKSTMVAPSSRQRKVRAARRDGCDGVGCTRARHSSARCRPSHGKNTAARDLRRPPPLLVESGAFF